jgi:hypothetical protein
MENPRCMNKCFYGLFVALALLSLLDPFLTRDSRPLLHALGTLGLFAGVCALAALVNLAIPPVFRLLARLTGKQTVVRARSDQK